MKKTPDNEELFAKGSSLVVSIQKDTKWDFDIMIHDRKSRRIITQVQTALVTLKDYMDLEPLPQAKRTKLTWEDIQCINFLMDFWESTHRESCKNEKVFKKFRRLRIR